MIFKYGFVHCDAHPGNIFIRRKPKSRNNNSEDYQIVLLDHGLYRTL
jgi:aarF domain-containing kinase